MAIAFEQVDDREIRRRLAVGHRGALKYRPPLCVVRVDELIHQARFPHAGFPNYGHHLAMPRPGLLQGLLQGRQLLLPPYETGEPACRAGLQTPAHRTGPNQLKDLYRVGQPLDRELS